MNPNVKQVIQQSIHLMNTNDKIVGFTFNNRTKRAWFHYQTCGFTNTYNL